MPLAYYTQQAGERLDYGFNWEPWLGEGATVVASTWDADGLTVDGDEIVGGGSYTTAFLSGGATGNVHRVRNTVTSSDGRTETDEVAVHVTAGDQLAMWATPEQVRAVNRHVAVDADLTDALVFASGLLHRLAGRQFGLRWRTIQPTHGSGNGCAYPAWWSTWDWWYRRSGGPGDLHPHGVWGCGGMCLDLVESRGLDLPGTPFAVHSITIGDTTLDRGDWYLKDRRVFRANGAVWPCWQNTIPLGLPGSWSVTYLDGRPVPKDGQLAAAALAAEFALSVDGSNACRLPQRLQTLVRQDVTMAFTDPMDYLDAGRTGVYLADLWLKSVNPQHLQRRPSVHRADDPRQRRA